MAHSLIGFYLLFEEDQVYADLHNVPFYYREWPGGFSAYEKRIIRHVRRSPVFRKWKGHASRFDAVHLPLFVELMGSLASQIVVEPGEEKLPNRWAAREQDTDEN